MHLVGLLSSYFAHDARSQEAKAGASSCKKPKTTVTQIRRGQAQCHDSQQQAEAEQLKQPTRFYGGTNASLLVVKLDSVIYERMHEVEERVLLMQCMSVLCAHKRCRACTSSGCM